MGKRKMKFWENLFLAIFAVILIAAIILGVILNMPGLSLVLLGIEFPIALLTAICASLRLRQEEEEKTMPEIT
jgi:membrane protein implicated in regulation of membrane protease activity